MKLRIRGDSLRLRLSKSELAQLEGQGIVCETIHFGPLPQQKLQYCLQISQAAQAIVATYTENCIRVILPHSLTDPWFAPHQVSLYGQQAIGSDRTLTILIEKDFACLKPRPGEDDGDAFANPNAPKSRGNDD